LGALALALLHLLAQNRNQALHALAFLGLAGTHRFDLARERG
jgi:hypothetical protein